MRRLHIDRNVVYLSDNGVKVLCGVELIVNNSKRFCIEMLVEDSSELYLKYALGIKEFGYDITLTGCIFFDDEKSGISFICKVINVVGEE